MYPPRQSLVTPVGVVSVAVVAAGLTVWWAISTWRGISVITEVEDQVTSRIELVKTLAQITLGALVFGTLWATWRRAKAAERTVEVSQESQITERFTRAIEQLGNRESIAIRLGGIYALERIAQDSGKDHWQVMEVLTAYVRENSPWDEHKQSVQPVTTDIQAALTVLGRRNADYDKPGQRLDLSRTHLHGARLTDANLRLASFMGTNLRLAVFFRVNLQGAIFQNAILQGAQLQGSNFNSGYFQGAALLLKAYPRATFGAECSSAPKVGFTPRAYIA